MKSITVAFVLALVASSQASILPLGLHPYGPAAAIIQSNLGHPAALSLGPYAAYHPALALAASAGLPAAISLYDTAGLPAPIIDAHHHAGPASYVAANRGSVHSAPLPGHSISQQSLNLAPAPGTL